MQGDDFSNKDEAFQAFDDIPLSPVGDDTMGSVIARRYGRRDILKGSLAVTAATVVTPTSRLPSTRPHTAKAALPSRAELKLRASCTNEPPKTVK